MLYSSLVISLLLSFLPVLLLSSSCLVVNGLSTVVYGPQSRELLLLTAKLAARQGIDTSCVCASGTENGCRRLMYGPEYAEAGIDAEGNVKPISSGEDMLNALSKADSLMLICYDNPIDEKSVTTLVKSGGENLSKVVLLSKMGVSKARGGFFGGGSDGKLKESEDVIRTVCQSNNLDLSIVRAGNLKGGGPGEEGNDYGLDKTYYNTIFDVVEASVTMAHDKFALGADCTRGDTIEMPNMFTMMGSKSSFEPIPYDSNRIIVAAAAVAASQYDTPIEFSVSSDKAEEPPTPEAWKEILSNL